MGCQVLPGTQDPLGGFLVLVTDSNRISRASLVFKSEPPGQAGSKCRQLPRGVEGRRKKAILFQLHWRGGRSLDEERMAGRKALGKVRKPQVPKKADVKNKQTKTNRQSKDKEKVAG